MSADFQVCVNCGIGQPGYPHPVECPRPKYTGVVVLHLDGQHRAISAEIEGRRFEVPSRLTHLERLSVRYARWDLSLVEVVDPRTRVVVTRLYPLDLSRNAEGRRRRREEALSGSSSDQPSSTSAIAPLLKRMLDEQRSSGLPPAFLPNPEAKGEEEVCP